MPYIIDSITAETVNVNQEILLDGRPVSSIPANTIEVTYQELYGLYTGGTLEKNAYYLITDFQTLHIIPNTTQRNDTNLTIPVEPLIVFATGVNQLAPQAWSTVYPKDVIEYDITGDYLGTLKPTGVKGCITYRKTGKFEMNWDFRHIVTRTWCYEMQSSWYSAYGFTTNFSTNGIQRGWNNTNSNLIVGILDGTNVNKNLTLLPESLSVFDAVLNPYGYKDRFIFDDNPSTSRFGNESSGFGIFGKIFTRTFPIMYCRDYNDSTTNQQIFYFNVENALDFNNVIIKSKEFFLTLTGFNLNNSRFYSLIPNGTNFVFAIEGQNNDFITSTLRAPSLRVSMYGDNRVNAILNGSNINQGDFVLDRVQRCVIKIPDSPGNGTYYRFYHAYGLNVSLPAKTFYYRSLFGYFGVSQEQTISSSFYYDGFFGSDIKRDIAAVSNINLSTADLAIAGILNLTGTGTVNIATLQRWNNGLYNFNPIVLKPQSGLTISIAPNNVANGFIQSGTITANGTNGEVIRLELVNDRWLAIN